MTTMTACDTTCELKIDPEFQQLIPPLTDFERDELKAQISRDGECLMPLVVWAERQILLDGHHRKDICIRLGLEYKVKEINLPSREEAKLWIIRQQIGRRNLTPDQISYLRGLEYQQTKQQHGGQIPGSSAQNAHSKTSDVLAKRHGVDAATIRRDAAFAQAVDVLDAGPVPGIKAKVFAGNGPAKATIVKAAKFAKRAPHRAVAMLSSSSSSPHVTYNSGDNEWFTPVKIANAVHEVMGGIDLDPASCEEANRVVKATQVFNAADNGLTKPWAGRVFLNPPYSKLLIRMFCSKLVRHVKNGKISAAVVLVNNATETRWFQELFSVVSAVCFPSGRVKFWQSKEATASNPLQGQAILYFGEDHDSFMKTFTKFGRVCRIIQPPVSDCPAVKTERLGDGAMGTDVQE